MPRIQALNRRVTARTAPRRQTPAMLALLGATLALLVALLFPVAARTAPSAPRGLTAYALDGKVSLAWQSASGASSYKVLRGTSAGAITVPVASGVTGTTYTDATAVDGTSYFYAVVATDGSGDSPPSSATGATPQHASCSSGNAIVKENCFPGSTGWKLSAATDAQHGGIEGFATAASVNRGSSVDLKVNTGDGVPYHIDVYRTGWYGGTQGRLVETLPGRTGVAQPDCQDPFDGTGLFDCSNWSATDTVTTSSDWPTGVYLLKLVRDTAGSPDNYILLVVRNDGGHEQAYYGVPVTSYQAYNNYGGRSLYDYNSYKNGNTIAGTQRAVKVSFDRPYTEPIESSFNWYGHDDIRAASWLERQGVDLSYGTSLDLPGGSLTNHKLVLSGVHDEYFSQSMRDALTSARNAGTSLIFLGSNADYWRIRFENNPYSSVANRIEVCYKTTQSGATDPVSATGTWRDPAGANSPENALIGQMYFGDDDTGYYPLQISATESQNSIWRHTDIYNSSGATLGQYLVGWEWDKRFSNGAEPAGVTTVASSPVHGEVLTDAGKTYQQNVSATTTATTYRAASGALVFATGVQNWSRGLAFNDDGVGEPNEDIQQATANILQDAGITPTTPDGITLDPPPPPGPKVSSTIPAAGATGVALATTVKAVFDSAMNPATLTSTTFKLTTPSGAAVAGSISYDATSRTATLTPTAALLGTTTYTATLSTGVKSTTGTPLAQAYSWSFATLTPPKPLAISSRSPASGAGGVSRSASVSVVFNKAIDTTTLTAATFKLANSSGSAVAATLSYNSATKTATLKPNSKFGLLARYTATVSTGVRATDGSTLPAASAWSFTTGLF